MQGPVFIHVEHGPDAGKRIPLTAAVVIGRQEGLEVTLNDPQVSRQHARIELQDGRITLTDLGGANGTFVNKAPITGSTQLMMGDAIELGETTLRITGPAPPQQTTVVGSAPPQPPAGFGAAPQNAAPPSYSAPAQRSGGSRAPLLIGLAIGAILLLCVCLGIMMVVLGGGGDDSSRTVFPAVAGYWLPPT